MLDKRTILIVVALALPLILLVIVLHSGAPKSVVGATATVATETHNTTAIRPHPTLEQVRTNVQNRLTQLQAMTPEQWPAERKLHPNSAPTLQGALDWNTKRLAQLNAMTPEQWEAEYKAKHPNG